MWVGLWVENGLGQIIEWNQWLMTEDASGDNVAAARPGSTFHL